MMALQLVLMSLATRAAEQPETVPVDLQRYLGTWYEIARFDHRFERGCEEVTATYTGRPKGEIGVVNACVKGGKAKSISGRAWVPDLSVPGKLKVQFFWPFSAQYWVLDLASDYSWALVGSPDRKNCWILSRTPVISEELFAALSERLRAKGFVPAKLIRVRQHASLPVTPAETH